MVDQASGHQILPDLVLLRLLEVAGIALMVAATPTLARSLKRDPAHAVLLGVGSPSSCSRWWRATTTMR